MITREDIITALRSIHFVERTEELVEKYRRVPGEKPFKPRKDKVFRIIENLGHSLYLKDGYYCIRESEDSDRDIIRFKFDNYWTYVTFRYYDSDKIVTRTSIGGFQRSVADNKYYRSGYPVAHSNDDVEDILKTVVGLYDESIDILNSGVKPLNAPIPDTKDLICIKTTSDDVTETLRKIKFLERATKMCQAFRNRPDTSLPKVEKDKIYEIIRSFGYEPGYEQSWYIIKNQFVGPYRFEMEFNLKHFVGDFSWYVYEEGVVLGGGIWLGICRELAGDKPFGPPYRPQFRNLEEFKRLIAVAFNMFEDFKYELCKSKGIDYTRTDPLKIWKDLYSGELKNAPGPDEN